jgi:hypothetical protein
VNGFSPWTEFKLGSGNLGKRPKGYSECPFQDQMLDEYYELRKWDKKTGWPTPEKLEELNLGDAADSLEKFNRLPNSPNRNHNKDNR